MDPTRRLSETSIACTKFVKKDKNCNLLRTSSFDSVLENTKKSNDAKGAILNTGILSPNDVTLTMVLGNKITLELFKRFVTKEKSDENLEFWCLVNTFRSEKTKKRKKLAKKMYLRFVKDFAERQVNLDHSLREKVKKEVQKYKVDIFDDAQKVVFHMMDVDSFRRFRLSEEITKCAFVLNFTSKT